MKIFKKFQFWIPAVYSLILIIDLEIGFNITKGQFLVWMVTPVSWLNFFQKASTFGIAIVLSFIIWYLIGKLIDFLIQKIKKKKINE